MQYRAFPQELPPEICSRDGRLIPLQILDVSASEKARLMANCGWYRGSIAFRPDCGMMGFIFLVNLLGGLKMKEQLEQIKQNALAALDAASTPAALEELRVKLLEVVFLLQLIF